MIAVQRAGLRLQLLVLAVVMGIAVSSSASAQTDRQDEISEEIESLKAQIGEASEDETRLLGEIDDATAGIKEQQGKVDALSTQVDQIGAQVSTVEKAVEVHQAEGSDLELQRAELDANIGDARSSFSSVASAMYASGNSDTQGFIAMAFDAADPRDLYLGSTYLSSISGEREAEVDRLSTLRNDAAFLNDEIAGQRAVAEDMRDQLSNEQDTLAAAREEQDLALQELEAQQAERQKLLDEAIERQDEFEAQISDLQQESDRITEALKAREAIRAGQSVKGSGQFIVPVAGRVTSGFGSRVHPISGRVRMHTGVDFGASTGTPILAADSGVVVSAGWRNGYGNTVLIDHGNGLATLYGHQSRLAVRAGQSVAQGDVIGYVGSTGNSTGPHLHFEVRKGGTPVNPMSYL